MWIAGVAALFFSSRFAPPPVSATVAAVWVAYCVYSWVVPPLVRKRVNAR